MALNLTQIAAIAGIVAGIGGPAISYVATTARLEEKATALQDGIRRHDDQFRGIYQFNNTATERMNTMAGGIIDARNATSMMGSDIRGDLKVIQSDIHHLLDAVAEVRGEQKRHALGGATAGGLGSQNSP